MSIPSKVQDSHLPEDCYDCISMELLNDPVSLPCGHTFNKKTVKDFLSKNLPCPIDSTPFEDYAPNYLAKKLIALLTTLHSQPNFPKTLIATASKITSWTEENGKAAKKEDLKSQESPPVPLFSSALPQVKPNKSTQNTTPSTHPSTPTSAKLATTFPFAPNSGASTQNSAKAPLSTGPLPEFPSPPRSTISNHSNYAPQTTYASSTYAPQTTYAPNVTYAPQTTYVHQTTYAPPPATPALLISVIPNQHSSNSAPALPSYISRALNPAGRGKALIRAVEEQDLASIEYLLKQETDVNARDGSNQTPLLMACKKGNLGIIELLISNGAKTDRDDAQTALSHAIKYNNLKIAQILVYEGTPVLPEIFDQAVSEGKTSIVAFFMTTGDRHNGIKLDQYVRKDPEDYAHHRYDFNVADDAFILACEMGHLEVVRLLNHWFNQGKERDHYCIVHTNSPDRAGYVVENHISVREKAKGIAKSKGHGSIVTLLDNEAHIRIQGQPHIYG